MGLVLGSETLHSFLKEDTQVLFRDSHLWQEHDQATWRNDHREHSDSGLPPFLGDTPRVPFLRSIGMQVALNLEGTQGWTDKGSPRVAGQREPAGSGWSHRQSQSRLLHGLEQKHCFGTKKKLTGLSTPESTDRCYVDKIHRNYLQPGGKKDSNIITREARRSQGKILEVWPLVHKASCEARPCSQGQLAGWPAAVRGPA